MCLFEYGLKISLNMGYYNLEIFDAEVFVLMTSDWWYFEIEIPKWEDSHFD